MEFKKISFISNTSCDLSKRYDDIGFLKLEKVIPHVLFNSNIYCDNILLINQSNKKENRIYNMIKVDRSNDKGSVHDENSLVLYNPTYYELVKSEILQDNFIIPENFIISTCSTYMFGIINNVVGARCISVGAVVGKDDLEWELVDPIVEIINLNNKLYKRIEELEKK